MDADTTRPAQVPFVGVARLELDELLDQLIERIHDVQRSQGRLRGLLSFVPWGPNGLSLELMRHEGENEPEELTAE